MLFIASIASLCTHSLTSSQLSHNSQIDMHCNYGSISWPVILKEGRRLKLFEKREQKRIFRAMRSAVERE
jgi:hypothetical protein